MDMIKRVTDLEAQLRARNTKYSQQPQATPPSPATAIKTPPKKKPKKAPKPFDPDKYSTRLIALKFAYLGANYNGFEHHTNNMTPLPTIEDELWKALRKTKLIFPRSKGELQSDEDSNVSWDGCDYSKCGRTDRGVSAFGQVIGVRVRSNRPKTTVQDESNGHEDGEADDKLETARTETNFEERKHDKKTTFDPVRDELPYIQLINRVLPPDIRVLAWCPDLPSDFSARFNCRERRYRYFFTNPAYMPIPESDNSEGWLDIEAMRTAAKRYEGLHDFRNLCKIDPSKQMSKFERRIFHAGIHEVAPGEEAALRPPGLSRVTIQPKLYYFEVRGSAFLWHQVRHLVAILFFVGQGYEDPSIVDELLDINKTPARPMYEMASDVPLVLWDCIFPKPRNAADHVGDGNGDTTGYEDALNWIYIGDESREADLTKRSVNGIEDDKYSRNGIVEDLWALWRKRKMDEVLASSLMEVVLNQGRTPPFDRPQTLSISERSPRVFDGSEVPRSVGKYIPILQRERMETPDVVNTRYAVRKGLNGSNEASDVDE